MLFEKVLFVELLLAADVVLTVATTLVAGTSDVSYNFLKKKRNKNIIEQKK